MTEHKEDIYVTTDTNQTAIDFYSNTTGEITVSGEYDTSLQYIIDMESERIVIASLSLVDLNDPIYPYYQLNITNNDSVLFNF